MRLAKAKTRTYSTADWPDFLFNNNNLQNDSLRQGQPGILMTWLLDAFGPTIFISTMSEPLGRNLTVFSKGMGQIVIQPESAPVEEVEQASLVIFPLPHSEKSLAAAVDWAGGSQTPIFCDSRELRHFLNSGFGAYRFHKLEGYREIDFQGGSLEFFPAQRAKKKNIKGFFAEVAEWLGFVKSRAFHVLIRPMGEKPILFLASKFIDSSQWALFSQFGPDRIFGIEGALTQEDCKELTQMLGRPVLSTEGLDFISTSPFSEKSSIKVEAGLSGSTAGEPQASQAQDKASISIEGSTPWPAKTGSV